jgi:SMC interacting uncharacterized protein involved in chromosome segregation
MTIGSSFKKQEKEIALQNKIEEESTPVEETKKSTTGLQKALEKKGISFNEFVSVAEDRRKLLLGDDYQETRTKYGWVYDQPIVQE